jgi:hypothetical protein
MYIEFLSKIINRRRDIKMVGDAGFESATSTVCKGTKRRESGNYKG